VGYRLAQIAEATTTRISPRGRLVLFRMCWHVLDNPKGSTPAHTYFGGWEVLELLFPDQTPGSAHVTVAGAIRELTDAGLIKVVDNPNGKRRLAYLITL